MEDAGGRHEGAGGGRGQGVGGRREDVGWRHGPGRAGGLRMAGLGGDLAPTVAGAGASLEAGALPSPPGGSRRARGCRRGRTEHGGLPRVGHALGTRSSRLAEKRNGRTRGPRPAGSGTSTGSVARLQGDWASTSEATSRTAPGILSVAVNAVWTQFAEYNGQLQEFAQGAQGRLVQLEQSIAVRVLLLLFTSVSSNRLWISSS